MHSQKNEYPLRPAFSLIELVMVIFVIAVLAALAIPRLNRDLRQEAADNILSAIRYTQSQALKDDKQLLNDPKWQRRWWKIIFGTCTGSDRFYMIGSDDDMNGNGYFTKAESAVDYRGKHYFWRRGSSCASGAGGDSSINPDIFLSKKYGINRITFGGGCAGYTAIGFDHTGRPHVGFGGSTQPDYSSFMSRNCAITFGFSDGNIAPFTIIIQTQTGYAYISGQNDS